MEPITFRPNGLRRLAHGLIMAVALTAPIASHAEDFARPNIVYFNVDDLGVMDVGFNSPRYRTPNIDKLRREGMLFTEAYAPAANCAPSRAAVFSGQYAPRHGVYTVGNSDRGDSRDRKLIPIKNTEFLPPEKMTLARALQQGGYKTIHLGKWHLGPDPTQQGFDINIGGDKSGGPSGGGYFSPFSRGPMKRFNDSYPKGTHRVDIFSDQALKFMRANKEKPFFLHMAFYSVHTGIEAVPEFVGHYKDKPVNAAYASMIEKMDQGVGRILDGLEELGLEENTLVVFCSDNGGVQNLSSQQPYRSGKGSYFEGGIREPLVVRWPGRIPADSTCKTPVIATDFFPTFIDVAGIKAPADTILDGVSLVPLFDGKGQIEERALFWHFPIYLQKYGNKDYEAHDPAFRTRPGSAMRMGKWKLHEYFEDGRIELYDLESDLGERHNLAATHPEKAAELHRMLKAWRKDVKAPVPTELNKGYKPKAK
ncbi:sulfatase [Haloferula chungangensis]|uniref:Sulfatase n=1 Tax=Haloferula chungangensis TaxID=1048331 RepID=A0ABW2L386_9BACT